MFKDFDISSFKKMKPPGDNTFDTMQEIKALKKIPIRKTFVKEFDDQESAFKKTAEREGIKDYDSSVAKKLIEKSAPVILKLKKQRDFSLTVCSNSTKIFLHSKSSFYVNNHLC